LLIELLRSRCSSKEFEPASHEVVNDLLALLGATDRLGVVYLELRLEAP
jgi:hypothetical protein